MKKFYLLGGMAVATALFAAATAFPTTFPGQTGEAIYADAAPQADGVGLPTPYYGTAAKSSSEISDGWTIIDANAAEEEAAQTSVNNRKKWEPTSENSSPTELKASMKIGYTPKTPGYGNDDYLISPAIHLEAGKEYCIAYYLKTGSNEKYAENLTIYLSPVNDNPEAIKASVKLDEKLNFISSSYTKFATKYTPTTTGDVYVCFYCHSGADKFGVYVHDLAVDEYVFAPSSITNLKAERDPNRALKCNLSWTLPTTEKSGFPMEISKITAVKVYRDEFETAVATLSTEDGQPATSFEDNESFGLQSGEHTYGVSFVAEGVESEIVKVGPTKYIGPLVPFPLPHKFTFNSEDEFEMWTVHKGSNSTAASSSYSTDQWRYISSYKYAQYGNTGDKYDDYLITPPMICEPGDYLVTLGMGQNSDTEGNLTLEYGDSPSIEAMHPFTESFLASNINSSSSDAIFKANEKKFLLHIGEQGTYYVAVHNLREKQGSYVMFFVKYISVEKYELVPNPVTNLKATPSADGSRSVTVSWTNPSTDIVGEPLSFNQYRVEVYVNDEESPVEVVEDGSESCVVNVDNDGVYTIRLKAVGAQSNKFVEDIPSVSTGWVGNKTVTLPYDTKFASNDGTRFLWDVVDANNDNATFSWSSIYGYSTTSAKVFEDYVVSPDFQATPGFYKAVFSVYGGSYGRSTNAVVGIVKKGEFDASDVSCYKATSNINVTRVYSPAEDYSFIFEVTDTDSYQIVFGIVDSFTYSSSINLKGVSIDSYSITPDDVKSLTVNIVEEQENTVELSWINPTTVYGTDSELSKIDAIVIIRNGETIATLEDVDDVIPGKEMIYVDSNAANGINTYSVYATIEGNAHEGAFPSVKTNWVGGGQSAPIDLTSANHPFIGWTTIDVDGNHDKNDMYTWRSYSKKYIIEGANFTNDDYLVSSPVKIKENEIYKITYFMSSPSGGNMSAINVGVKMGAHNEDATTYPTVHTINLPAEQGFKNYSFYVAIGSTEENEEDSAANGIMMLSDETPTPEELYNQAAKVPAAGDYRVALHATEKGGIQMTEFHMAKVADYETPTSEIVEVGAGKVTFDGQDVNFGGVATVQVYNLAGVCVANTTAEGSFNVSKLGAGYYVVKVTTDSETVTLKVTVK